jgi:hypothetical protein
MRFGGKRIQGRKRGRRTHGDYSIRNNAIEDRGTINSKRICREIVDEPNYGDGEKSAPVFLDNEPIGYFNMSHPVFCITITLFHFESEVED